VREEHERVAYGTVLRWLTLRGHPLFTIAWDRGKVIELDLDAFGPVEEIEDINRWRLPQRLGHAGLRPVARQLRNRRVVRWWRRAGRPRHALLLGPLRAEMVHYLPPGAHVGALLGWRDTEDPESEAATAGAAHTVLARDDATVARFGSASGTARVVGDLERHAHRHVWPRGTSERARLSSRHGLPADAVVVGALGPIDRRGAPDLFLRTAARLRVVAPELPVHLAWLGVDPDGVDAYPYRFDTERLGLGDVMHWLGDPEDHRELLRRLDVVLLVGRESAAVPDVRLAPDHPATGDLLRGLGVPILGFDVPATREVGGDGVRLVDYPDVHALADALAEVLRADRPHPLDEAVDHLLGSAAR
jgi:glycosyltransferase involved in cell wall biosynthesis